MLKYPSYTVLMSSSPILECPRKYYPESADQQLSNEEQEAVTALKNMSPWLSVLPDQGHEAVSSVAAHAEFEDFGPDPMSREYWLEYLEKYCDVPCLCRYLRANGWSVEKAYSGLVSTLKWRHKFRPHLITATEVEDEARTGKNYLNGFDMHGRPVIYLRNYRQNTSNYRNQIRFLVFNLERAIAFMPPRVEKLTLLFDFSKYSARNAPPMNVSKYTLHLLAAHFPERCAAIYACEAPWYFWVFYKVIKPWINPVTQQKIRFVQVASQLSVKADQDSDKSGNMWVNLLNHIDTEYLESTFGGKLDFDYNHEIYWPLYVAAIEKSQSQ